MPSQEQVESESAKPRSVHPCDFRSAGRLSNQNARALSAMHELFARHLTIALNAYLGTDLTVRLITLDQLPTKDHIASVAPLSYLAPFSITTIPSTLIVEFDIDLASPIIDLLLGGKATPANDARELSEIEEEIMQDMTMLVARQAESAWRMPEKSLAARHRIEPAALNQYCPPNEKVTLVKFEVDLAGITGSFCLVFPTSLVNVLIKTLKADQPDEKRGELRYFPTASLRERMLDCDVTVAADLRTMRVSVRDLIALQPGCVLKLRAPVKNPGTLTLGGHEIFEAVPVRNGSQKAAQLLRKVEMTTWAKE
jgi:flagellar motor switch protein FliM